MALRTFNRCKRPQRRSHKPPGGGLAGAVPPASFVLDSGLSRTWSPGRLKFVPEVRQIAIYCAETAAAPVR
jgi:hypothetical protein